MAELSVAFSPPSRSPLKPALARKRLQLRRALLAIHPRPSGRGILAKESAPPHCSPEAAAVSTPEADRYASRLRSDYRREAFRVDFLAETRLAATRRLATCREVRIKRRWTRLRGARFSTFWWAVGHCGRRPVLLRASPVKTRTWYNSNSLLMALGSPFRARLRSRLRRFISSSSVWEAGRRSILLPFLLPAIVTIGSLRSQI